MSFSTLTRSMLAVILALSYTPFDAEAQSADDAAIQQATVSAEIAGHSLSKVHRWLHEIALPKIDPETGLYFARGLWNYRDTAADCYPFLTWAAHVVDQDALNGPVRDILHAERRLCNVLDRIPVPWDRETNAPVKDFPYDDMVFEASEYVKDGLIAIVEVTGPGEWLDRMQEIEDDLWTHARIESPFGKLISTNIEVNGEQLQALARLYTITGDPKYLEFSIRIAEYYFAEPDFVPTRLRDHGCEIIGGLGLLQAVLVKADPHRAQAYAEKLKHIYDTILARGCNADGIMYNHLDENHVESSLSDGWGYNYVGYLCYDLAMNTNHYTDTVATTLRNLAKPLYANYDWERESIDGYADSIEGGIYLLNRVPVKEGFDWVNQETRNNVVDHPTRLENGELWGTMKLQANGVRTTIMQALMHTQGLIARPWAQGLQLGAAPTENGLTIVMNADTAYEGKIVFDIPRHRLYMGFEKDWPRMNTLPEWFTVEPDMTYTVWNSITNESRAYTGQQLHNGLKVNVPAGSSLHLKVTQ